jgi:DNA-binding NtrC family response regulator
MTLAEHFLSKFNSEIGRSIFGFETAAVHAIQHYSWPGNVRELQNVIERAVLLGKSSKITVDDLPANLTNCLTPAQSIVSPSGKQTLKEAMEAPERQIILQVLRDNNWNRSETAGQLGVNRTTLYKKMKKLGLDHPNLAAF